MGDLTANFSRSEFACRHCGAIKIDAVLVSALQQMRDLCNSQAELLEHPPIIIRVNCGYRCPAHNIEVGGEPNSQHLLGKAADITLHCGNQTLSIREMYAAAQRIPVFNNGGIGLYPQQRFIHVDVRNGHARWGKINGKFTTADEALLTADHLSV